MSPGLMKMWISFGAMGFMIISIISIYFSRYKLKGVFRIITALIAYVFMILAGIIMFLIVISGPTS
ncbi:DUF2768 domain-containing protein [Bacillus methanolicus]|uniref:Putative membrane protein n=1 Tax=Bacillus methanolicus (strain MGA3 / ATCC 53907) TaxID=796606 RepID=I3E9Z0_BACMM|nr:DUF2768 domain-containing protein [Bacillus methanolicus]AIE60556.1 putative membrane protein [Bacillus methanolicus MGA3]EIJ83311.1 hypothetical protein MGA3_08825 [Bacillus methanolicus MGA3]UQD52566.1 DUF2768 domain-containing protein [Bacillus methanolicus]